MGFTNGGKRLKSSFAGNGDGVENVHACIQAT